MKQAICPYCGHRLPLFKERFADKKVIKQILKKAKRPTPIKELALLYSQLTGTSYLSSRRAIERLTQNKYLTRIKPGYYIVR